MNILRLEMNVPKMQHAYRACCIFGRFITRDTMFESVTSTAALFACDLSRMWRRRVCTKIVAAHSVHPCMSVSVPGT